MLLTATRLIGGCLRATSSLMPIATATASISTSTTTTTTTTTVVQAVSLIGLFSLGFLQPPSCQIRPSAVRKRRTLFSSDSTAARRWLSSSDKIKEPPDTTIVEAVVTADKAPPPPLDSLNSTNNIGPVSMAEKAYWDAFYQRHNEHAFEWLLDYAELIECGSDDHDSMLTQQDANKHHHQSRRLILDAGCGTSLFSLALALSYRRVAPAFVVCADFSAEALAVLRRQQQQQQQRVGSVQFVDHVQCDCKRLPFRDNLFDVVVDKGYVDSELKANGGAQVANTNALCAIQNLLDKLRFDAAAGGGGGEAGGSGSGAPHLLQVTDEPPELRFDLLDGFAAERPHASYRLTYRFKEVSPLTRDAFTYFCYFVYKTPKGSEP